MLKVKVKVQCNHKGNTTYRNAITLFNVLVDCFVGHRSKAQLAESTVEETNVILSVHLCVLD